MRGRRLGGKCLLDGTWAAKLNLYSVPLTSFSNPKFYLTIAFGCSVLDVLFL
jgi:hypothetical protein